VRPFETWQQIEAIAAQLGPVYGPMVVFAAPTGLRPAELFALEHRDLDFKGGAVYVRRAYANGRVWHVKTRRSMRRVPMQGIAFEALRRHVQTRLATSTAGHAARRNHTRVDARWTLDATGRVEHDMKGVAEQGRNEAL
jgi:integrase